MIHVETFTLGLFEVHNYLVWDDTTQEAVLFDTGKEPTPIIDFVHQHKLSLNHLFHTHAHIDHVEGHAAIRDAFPKIEAYLHTDDTFWLDYLDKQAAMFRLERPRAPKIDHPVEPGEHFSFQTFHLEARHAPGHAPGSICYWIPEIQSVFVGDVIFAGSIGRTDLPQGNFETLIQSIDREILTLPDITTIYSGHGPTTTVGKERLTNPFVKNHAHPL